MSAKGDKEKKEDRVLDDQALDFFRAIFIFKMMTNQSLFPYLLGHLRIFTAISVIYCDFFNLCIPLKRIINALLCYVF